MRICIILKTKPKKSHHDFSSLVQTNKYATTENTQEVTSPHLGSSAQLRIKCSISKHNRRPILMLTFYAYFSCIPDANLLTELACSSICVSQFQHCFQGYFLYAQQLHFCMIKTNVYIHFTENLKKMSFYHGIMFVAQRICAFPVSFYKTFFQGSFVDKWFYHFLKSFY